MCVEPYIVMHHTLYWCMRWSISTLWSTVHFQKAVFVIIGSAEAQVYIIMHIELLPHIRLCCRLEERRLW